MRLVRYGDIGQEKPGLIDAAGILRDLSDHIADIDANSIDDASLDRLRALDPASLASVAGSPRLGACIADVGKFICIGLNLSLIHI